MLRAEARQLKEALAEVTLENRNVAPACAVTESARSRHQIRRSRAGAGGKRLSAQRHRFGDEKTIVATGAIDAQTGRFSWTMDGLLGDFAISEGWLSSMHLRSAVDLNGDGRVEIFAAGDLNTRIIAQA
jgi:hypothetical protein